MDTHQGNFENRRQVAYLSETASAGGLRRSINHHLVAVQTGFLLFPPGRAVLSPVIESCIVASAVATGLAIRLVETISAVLDLRIRPAVLSALAICLLP